RSILAPVFGSKHATGAFGPVNLFDCKLHFGSFDSSPQVMIEPSLSETFAFDQTPANAAARAAHFHVGDGVPHQANELMSVAADHILNVILQRQLMQGQVAGTEL